MHSAAAGVSGPPPGDNLLVRDRLTETSRSFIFQIVYDIIVNFVFCDAVYVIIPCFIDPYEQKRYDQDRYQDHERGDGVIVCFECVDVRFQESDPPCFSFFVIIS